MENGARRANLSQGRTVARTFGVSARLVGPLGFRGRAVTGNGGRVVNVYPGHLFGVAATNRSRALFHLSTASSDGDERTLQFHSATDE